MTSVMELKPQPLEVAPVTEIDCEVQSGPHQPIRIKRAATPTKTQRQFDGTGIVDVPVKDGEDKVGAPIRTRNVYHRHTVAQSDADGMDGNTNNTVEVPNVKYKAKLRRSLQWEGAASAEAARRLTAAEILLPESEGTLECDDGNTFKVSQEDILREIDTGTRQKVFDLNLSMGPYSTCYSPNGRHLLCGGARGSLAMLNVQKMSADLQLEVKETVRDVKFFHNHTMWAAAQKKSVFVYDTTGTEIHCLRDHKYPYKLEMLPYHFLLASIGQFGDLRYTDVSCGETVAVHKTKKGLCDVMRANPRNAVMHCGHNDGSISLWTPNVNTPVASFLGHKGKIVDLGFSSDSYSLYSAGLDGFWKIWDIRKYQPRVSVHCGATATTALCVSGRGTVAVAANSTVKVWQDREMTKMVDFTELTGDSPKNVTPYMFHQLPGNTITSMNFQPYEDILCLGHTGGVSSMIVPGSAVSNFDSFSANPYETTKQRQEREVHMLLEKLPASTITLNHELLGGLDRAPAAVRKEEADAAAAANEQILRRKNKRGRDATVGFLKAKKAKHTEKLRDTVRTRLSGNDAKTEEEANGDTGVDGEATKAYSALDRFNKRHRKH